MKDLKKLLESVGISEENQQLLESGIDEIVTEKVQKEVNERVVVLEDEIKDQYAKASEQYIEEQVNEQIEIKTKELNEKTEQDKIAFEEKMVSFLDQFLENEINENISEEFLSKVAINECLVPVVEGIKKVFVESGLDISTDAEAIIEKTEKERDQYKQELDKTISEKVELAQIGEKAASQLKLIEITKDLPASIAEQVIELYQDKPFVEINEKAEKYAEMLVEKLVKSENSETTISETVETNVEDNPPAKKVDSLMSEATKLFSK